MKRTFILATLLSLTSLAFSQGVYQIVSLLEDINTDDTFIIYGKKKDVVSTSAINGNTYNTNYMEAASLYKKQINDDKGEIYIHSTQTKKDIPAEFKLIPVEGKANTYLVKLANQEQYLFNKSDNYLILANETENQVTRKQWELRTSSFNGICLKNIGSGNFIYGEGEKFGAYSLSSKDCLGVLCRKIPNAFAIEIKDPFYTATVLPHDADFTVGNIGLKGFIVSDISENVTLKEVDKAAEGEGIVLYANEQGKQFYPIFPSETSLTKNEENKLLPSDGSVKGDGKTIYALGNKTQGVGFYIVKSGVAVPKGKPYLKITNGTAAKEFMGFDSAEEDNVTTGITEVPQKRMPSDRWYNLKGQQVTNPQRGLYIHQGKKVFVE